MSESNDQQPLEHLTAELRATSKRGVNGEMLPPVGYNVQIAMRLKNDDGEVVKDWFNLPARSFSIEAEALSVTWAKVELKLVDIDLDACPEPGEFSQEDLHTYRNSEENK